MSWIQLDRYKIKVYGKNSDDALFLHNLLTNNIKSLKQGQFNYNLRLTKNGEPTGDFFVYRCEDFFILDTDINPKVLIQEFNKLKLSLKVFFEELDYRHIFVFGETIKKIVKELPHNFQFIKQDKLYIGRNTVRYGLDGIEVFGDLSKLVNQLSERDRLTKQKAEDLRIRNCVPKVGKELKKGFHPLEANIPYAFSFNKGCYIGQEAIARVHFRGKTNRTLALFKNKTPPPEGDRILLEDKEIGVITSMTSDSKYSLGYIFKDLYQKGKVLNTESGSVEIVECRTMEEKKKEF